MLELKELLKKQFITKEDDDFFLIKNTLNANRNNIRELLDRFGYEVHVGYDIIYLKKDIPEEMIRPWHGIHEFKGKLDYILFSSLLIYLDENNRNIIFSFEEVLSGLESIIRDVQEEDDQYRLDKITTAFHQSIYRVMVYAERKGLIKRLDGNYESILTYTTEIPGILYKNTGLSSYFILDQSEITEKSRLLYRKLMTQPLVMLDHFEKQYIRVNKNSIESDFEEFFDEDLDLVIVDDTFAFINHNEGNYFPGINSRKDWLLFRVCNKIREENDPNLSIVNREYLEQILDEVRIEDGEYWTKEMTSWGKHVYYRNVMEGMESHGMIRILENEEIELLPPVYYFRAEKDRKELLFEKLENKGDVQISLRDYFDDWDD